MRSRFTRCEATTTFDSFRPRSVKNIRQHAATVQQLSDRDLVEALDWFRTLPMWLECEGPSGTSVSRCPRVLECA